MKQRIETTIFCLLFTIVSQSGNAKGRPFYIKQVRAGIDVMPQIIIKPDYYKYNYFQLSYSAGLVMQFKTNRKTDFTIGLQFTNIIHRGKEHPYIIERDVRYYFLDTLISKEKWSSSNRNLEMPFIFNYNLGGKKIKYTVNTGFSLSCKINSKYSYTDVYKDGHVESGTFLETSKYNRFDILPQLSLGVEKEVADDLFLKIEPIIRMQTLNSDLFEDFLIGINFTLLKALY